MFKITTELRDHLVKTFGMSNALSDAQVREFAVEKLDIKTIRELSAAPGGNRIKGLFKEAINELKNEGSHMDNGTDNPTSADLLGGNGAGHVRVKAASEFYSTDRRPALHKKTGQPVTLGGRSLYEPSELQLAKIGAFVKHRLIGNSATLQEWGMKVPDLREHERQLLAEVYSKDAFCGRKPNDQWVDRATIEQCGLSVKALLDNSLSGGQNLVPYEFDQAVIMYPLLHSEILPYVDMREAVSSEVKTAGIGNVSVSWGEQEGTDISLFDTDSLVTGLSAPINAVSASIEYGKDFEADTPVADFGAILQELFGQAMLKELDRVACLGDGISEPEGFLVATGTVAPSSDNNTTGPPTLNDYVKLQFAIGKQYRRPELNPVYVSNDTSYQRSRQLKVDPTTPTSTDQRLLLGMDLQNYETLGFGHKVQNDIGNSVIAFVCLKKYRMYRRAGFDFFLTDQGKSLARRNAKLLVVRGRYGGLLTDANACAVIDDAQS